MTKTNDHFRKLFASNNNLVTTTTSLRAPDVPVTRQRLPSRGAQMGTSGGDFAILVGTHLVGSIGTVDITHIIIQFRKKLLVSLFT